MGRALMGTGSPRARTARASPRRWPSARRSSTTSRSTARRASSSTSSAAPTSRCARSRRPRALVQEQAHEDANIIFGASIDETLGENVKVTVIATGFDASRAHGDHERGRAPLDPGAADGPVDAVRAAGEPAHGPPVASLAASGLPAAAAVPAAAAAGRAPEREPPGVLEPSHPGRRPTPASFRRARAFRPASARPRTSRRSTPTGTSPRSSARVSERARVTLPAWQRAHEA